MSLSGVILLNKPCGLTSRDCVNKLVKLSGNKKIGHAGTLDPGATGMLPIFIGKSTKFIRFLVEQKSYSVVMQLGTKTTTLDNLGDVVATKAVPKFSEAAIVNILTSFMGNSRQTVPLVSAVRVNGKRLYEYARNQQQVDLPTRDIVIHDIKLNSITMDSISFDVVCSKGTYIRSLVEDVAAKLETYAHVVKLHRNWVAPFMNDDMVDLQKIINYKDSKQSLASFDGLLSLSTVFASFPRLDINDVNYQALLYGQDVKYAGNYLLGTKYTVFNRNNFFGIVQIDAARKIRVEKLCC